MATLVIDTATAACSVAVLEGTTVFAHGHEIVGRGHAERLMPMVEACMAGRRVDRILVDCGPGSFTGVRVGLAAAKALGLAWGVEVCGYSSLSLLAAMADAPEVGVAIEGGHGEYFVQRFAGLLPVEPLRSLKPDEAALYLTDPCIVGSRAAEVVAARGYGLSRELLPEASEAWRLLRMLACLPPAPLYGRAPDARIPT
jgi:tRNA threonylcarbamoyl adenosine modification protein YeaZ